MRIEPPPSLACAAGTSPAATAAADPPLEPPGERSRSHGLWVGPKAIGSVVGRMPSSGVFVRPRITSPAARWRPTSVVSMGARQPARASAITPFVHRSPSVRAQRSFTRNGTPRNGPSGSAADAAASRARSKVSVTTALSAGLPASIRSIAASTSSAGVASPACTSAACAVASSQRVSSAIELTAPVLLDELVALRRRLRRPA